MLRTTPRTPLLLALATALAALTMCAPAEAYVFFGNSDDDQVGRSNNDGSQVETDWLSGIEDPAALASDGGDVYWASDEGDVMGATTVGGIDAFGQNFRASIFTTEFAPLTLGAASGELYLTGEYLVPCDDDEAEGLLVSSDGLNQNTLIQDQCIGFGGVAATENSVFYVNGGNEGYVDIDPEIVRIDPDDPDQRTQVVDESLLDDPFGLTTDGTYLYWSDWGTNSIGRATLAPNGTVTAVNPNFITDTELPGWMAVNSDYLYWISTDLDDGDRLYRADKDGSDVTPLFYTGQYTETNGGKMDWEGGLAVTDPAPHAAVSPATVGFGARNVGAGPSSPQDVQLLNEGDGALTAPQVSKSGPNPGDFQVDPSGCSQGVQPEGGCAIEVTFEPSAPGNRSATIELADNDAGSPQTFEVHGTGLGPALSLTPTDQDFGDQLVGSGPGNSETFTISNPGNAPLDVTGLGFGEGTDGNWYLSNVNYDRCVVQDIAPGGSCSFTVQFDPQSAGALEGSVDVYAMAPAVPSSVSATLTGTGTAPVLDVQPQDVDFPDTVAYTSSAPIPVTIENNGTAPASVVDVVPTEFYANQFLVGTTCNGQTIQPGAECIVDVTFSPTSGGPKAAPLEIEVQGQPPDTSANLSGTGLTPDVSLTPGTYDFGSINASAGPSATQTFTFESTGNEPITVGEVVIEGTESDEFKLVAGANQCDNVTLDQNESCTVGVAFAPGATGDYQATLEVPDDVYATPHTASLAGTATAPGISVSPGSLAFGEALLGSGGGTSSFSVGNPGTGPLTVRGAAIKGPGAAAYTVDASDCTGAPIPPATASGCTVDVAFAPGSAGEMHATVQVNSDAAAGTGTVALDGLACPPLVLSARALRSPRPHRVAVVVDSSPGAMLSVSGILRFRLKGKGAHSAHLGTFSVASGTELVLKVPKAVAKRLKPRAKAQLELTGSATATSPAGCAAQQLSEPPLPVRVGR